jgi:pyruvate/2-oxoglutarate dehydrogenase complex dihydrolipoamide acyltransferase (E2) component
MRVAVPAPRVNNNDDSMRVGRILVSAGTMVARGDAVAEVITDKATMVVESPVEGEVVEICAGEGASIEVDAPLLWLRDSRVDEADRLPSPAGDGDARPTFKARLLLQRHGLSASEVPSSGSRLTATDVEAHLAASRSAVEAGDSIVLLTAEERGVLRTIAWHHEHAVPAYVEVEYDATGWQAHAERFQATEQLLFSPLQSLMAWRAAQLAGDRPNVNSVILPQGRRRSRHVGVGLTVQAASTLYLVVIHRAETLTAREFCDRATTLQRDAIGGVLRPEDAAGATLGFSSMARWQVRRHIPLLPSHTSLMLAHSAADRHGRSVLGATYDHRALSGGEVAEFLEQLACAPNDDAGL